MNDPVSGPRDHRPGVWATVLAVSIAVMLGLPVALLPLTPAVPPLVWVPLPGAQLAHVAWLIARRAVVEPSALWRWVLIACGGRLMGQPRMSLINPFLAPSTGVADKVNHTRGLIDSFNTVYPQLEDLDFVDQAPTLQAWPHPLELAVVRRQLCVHVSFVLGPTEVILDHAGT